MAPGQLVWALTPEDDRLDQIAPHFHPATSNGGPLSPETCTGDPVAYLLNSDTFAGSHTFAGSSRA